MDVTRSALLETHENPKFNQWTDTISKENFCFLLKFSDHTDKIRDIIEGTSLTLTHIDCMVGKLCIRWGNKNLLLRLVVPKVIGPPQHSLAIMLILCFVEKEKTIVEYHEAVRIYITSSNQHIAPVFRGDKGLIVMSLLQCVICVYFMRIPIVMVFC
jgi:hypothetical protein